MANNPFLLIETRRDSADIGLSGIQYSVIPGVLAPTTGSES